jgi:protein FAM50
MFADDPILRLKKIQKQREKEHEQYEKAVSKIKEQVIVKPIHEKFHSKFSTEDDLLRQETIGLQSLSDFRKKRQRIESGAIESISRESAKSKVPQQAKPKGKLSFNFDEDEEEEEEEVLQLQKKSKGGDIQNAGEEKRKGVEVKEEEEEEILQEKKKSKGGGQNSGEGFTKLGKDPTIDTSFLPDKGRDEFLEQEKRRLQLEWLRQQEEIKEAPLHIDYCFYDGTSHRKTMCIKKGSSIKEFLLIAKKQFPEIQDVGTDSLLFVKENVIIPHQYTFYELIESKAQGKTGTLDNWVLEGDNSAATRTGAHAHIAKIVERHFYERNKHIYPFNLWEVYVEKPQIK